MDVLEAANRVIMKFYYEDTSLIPRGTFVEPPDFVAEVRAESRRISALPVVTTLRVEPEHMLQELQAAGYVLMCTTTQDAFTEREALIATRFMFRKRRLGQTLVGCPLGIDAFRSFAHGSTWRMDARIDRPTKTVRLRFKEKQMLPASVASAA